MQSKKIMIVDDDENLLKELQETLEHNGYEAIAMSDSITAFNEIHKIKPDLIILDLRMDGMNGFQLAKSLKRFPSVKHIPIIAMTGFFKSENHYDLMDLCGMKMCLEKPFNPFDMIIIIKDLFKERKKYHKK